MKNEIKVLRAFIEEFHPFYQGQLEGLSYWTLIDITKEIVKEF